jgi:dolichol-phosphate mannosyltransferase
MWFTLKEVPLFLLIANWGTSKMSGGIFGEAFLGVIQLKIKVGSENYPQKK